MRAIRSLVIFALGLVAGVAVALLGPGLVEPLVPEALRSKAEVVQGHVTRKQADGERLLLTVVTSRGAVLATFTQRRAEVDLLVQEGDQLTLALRRFAPFVNDPEIRQVLKARGAGPGEPRSGSEPAVEQASPGPTDPGGPTPGPAPATR